ncbi:hypothetical protein BB8028_0003g01400 [Beauveria bassiana]|uniref:Uncharacterized protein n=1 Tax=Beauveria bassiana TaxID=176275 RepID=A0A2S7Y5W6_BEABA|nr:hypothetical protein BB8028_0003g01400 [Beauveria bassiana]
MMRRLVTPLNKKASLSHELCTLRPKACDLDIETGHCCTRCHGGPCPQAARPPRSRILAEIEMPFDEEREKKDCPSGVRPCFQGPSQTLSGSSSSSAFKKGGW